MNATTLLQWQNLIFLLPCGLAAVLLLLSSLHLGHHTGHGHAQHHPAPMGHGHANVPAAHSAHAPAHGHGHMDSNAARTPATHGHGHARVAGKAGHRAEQHGERQEGERPNVAVTTNFVLHLTGADRAPLTLILEVFCLVWGLAGFAANRSLLHTTEPTPRQILPSLLIALGIGLIGARFGAEILARVMPQEESLDVGRDGLFGLTGTVAYSVTPATGRIHIYDGHGTLHDESCRVVADHPGIEKGRRAMVVDVDTQGMLVVEEVPETVK
jgi:membrane protein implicated in regulation of membrane protease activity